MSKLFGILIGLLIAAAGWWRIDSMSAQVCWVAAAVVLTFAAVFVKRGAARVPVLRLTFTVVLVIAAFVSTLVGNDRPQLGLDLQGGVSIVLFPVEGSDLSQLNTAVDIISRRISGLGVSEPEVSRQGDTIVVDIPGLKDPERAVELVGRTACLRFRAVTDGPIPADATVDTSTTSTTPPSTTSTTDPDAPTTTTDPDAPTTTTDPDAPTTTTDPDATTTTSADATTTTTAGTTTTGADATTTSGADATTTSGGPTTTAGPTTTTVPPPKLNCDVSPGTPTNTIDPSDLTGDIPGDSIGDLSEVTASASGVSIATTPIAATRPAQEDTTTAPAVTTVAGATTSTTAATGPTTTTVAPTTTTLPIGANICDELVGEDDPDGSVWLYDENKESCYQVGPTLLTGRAVKTAGKQYDQEWKVDVEFRNDDFVTNVASQYVGQRVAIVLDDRVQSAPTINEGITGRNVQITGGFKEKEAADLANQLRYGSLPVQFDESETTQQSVSPSLGKDQLRAGIAAGVLGLALVALYMLFFYRLLGLVVWLGLALTSLIFFALVTYLGNSESFGLALTLSGVTGLIVSVGVTVDSYVVYFERLKDEVRSGKTIRSSLDSGFTRAFRTIVAADLVSLIGAGVLYILAIGSVKGFAFFLGLSTLIDLLIAWAFMYPLVWFLARRPGLVRMRGMGIAAGLDVAGKVDV